MASNFSMDKTPFLAAAIIPASSLTGIKAPESPPTLEEAITPPFLTASLSLSLIHIFCKGHISECSSPDVRCIFDILY